MEHFLFDLDGTLLPMDQRRFVEFYMPLLAARFKGRGVPQEELIAAVWKGVEAMAAFHSSGRSRGRSLRFLWK